VFPERDGKEAEELETWVSPSQSTRDLGQRHKLPALEHCKAPIQTNLIHSVAVAESRWHQQFCWLFKCHCTTKTTN